LQLHQPNHLPLAPPDRSQRRASRLGHDSARDRPRSGRSSLWPRPPLEKSCRKHRLPTRALLHGRSRAATSQILSNLPRLPPHPLPTPQAPAQNLLLPLLPSLQPRLCLPVAIPNRLAPASYFSFLRRARCAVVVF